MRRVSLTLLAVQLVFFFLAPTGVAQAPKGAPKSPDGIWRAIDRVPHDKARTQPWVRPQKFRPFTLHAPSLQAVLRRAPREYTKEVEEIQVIIHLPMPDGGFGRFRIVESPIMEPELAAKFPEIKTYLGAGLDDPSASLRMDWTPAGFHAQILSPNGAVYIDPYSRGDTELYASYHKRDYRRQTGFICLTEALPSPATAKTAVVERSGPMLRTYRLACAATGEYTQYHGGTVASGMAAIVTAINRVTGVYETELAIRLVLVANNNLIVYTNPNTDPYTNNNASQLLTQNQSNLDSVIGNANYDIGHVFSTGGGGLASLAVVCTTGLKARGETGLSDPIGDPFYIDFVAHEMGHQFGANHTFNGTQGNCAGGNRNGSTAYEPGSGSTIMAYAGICGTDDLQAHSDPYFHFVSFDEITAYIAGSGACSANTATGNTAPSVSAGANYTIPSRTPFVLLASGSDPNGDPLTYCWEQRDLGAAQQLSDPDNGASPLFRSLNPTNNPARTFPRLSGILSGANATAGEKLPTLSRTMKFRVTARDNRAGGGGVNTSDTQLSVVGSSGPFRVTSPNTAVTWTGSRTVTWDVAGTSTSPINAANVNILLSIDGGISFPIVLAASTANDGAETIVLPDMNNPSARVKIEAVGNVFFDISDANFAVIPFAPFVVSGGATLTAENCAPANDVVDPNEAVTMNFGLSNIGPVPTTNLVATLQAAGGVTWPSAPQNFGALSTNGAVVTRAFSFRAAGVCGSNVTAVLQLQDGATNLGSVTNLIVLGGLTAPATNDFSSGGLSVPIPDLFTTEVSLSITNSGLVGDVNVRVRLNHTFDGDLIIDLVHPDGTVVNLSNRRGGGSNNYGSGANACNGKFTVFDDAAATAIGAGSAPFASAFRPEQPLATLNGKPVGGTWKLRITDAAAGDTGTLGCWQLQIARQQYVCCTGALNSPPVINAAAIVPPSPNTMSNLVAMVTSANDPDGDPITYAYQWQDSADDTNFSNIAFMSDTLAANNTIAGKYYRNRITPNDGQVNGGTFTTASVFVPLDSDGNGLNDDWEAQNFGTIGVDPSADPDGDGQTNAQEFVAGTNPNNAASALRITSIEQVGSDVRIRFTTELGKSYDVEWTTDLPSSVWNAVTNNVTGTGSDVTVTDTGAATKHRRIYRIRVLTP